MNNRWFRLLSAGIIVTMLLAMTVVTALPASAFDPLGEGEGAGNKTTIGPLDSHEDPVSEGISYPDDYYSVVSYAPLDDDESEEDSEVSGESSGEVSGESSVSETEPSASETQPSQNPSQPGKIVVWSGVIDRDFTTKANGLVAINVDELTQAFRDDLNANGLPIQYEVEADATYISGPVGYANIGFYQDAPYLEAWPEKGSTITGGVISDIATLNNTATMFLLSEGADNLVHINSFTLYAYREGGVTPSTEPSASNTEPSASGTEPSASGTEPSASGTEPSASGTEPSASGTEPSASGTEPSASGTEPSASQTLPSGMTLPSLPTQSSATVPSGSSTEPSVSTPTEPGVLPLYGDANEDGAVNMKDVLLMRKYVAEIPVTLNFANSDVNADDAVNMKDILSVRKFVAELIDHLGPEA